MNNRNRILVVASVVFGVICAILAVTDSPALVWFAVIGGVALGLAWAFSGRFVASRERAR